MGKAKNLSQLVRPIGYDSTTNITTIKSGASDTTAVTIDGSQNATFAGNVIGVLKSGTAVASTSGTSIDFTGIPSTAKRITVMFNGVSTSGASLKLLQIGPGSFALAGYISTGSNFISSATGSTVNNTSGFVFNSASATDLISGTITLTNISGNSWVQSHSVKISTNGTAFGSGNITLAGTLDRVRVTTVNGTDTFDAGTVNILWE